MSTLIVSSPDELLQYSRKSRADNPSESVEEVLSKHQHIMEEFCIREFGFPVPEGNTFREVVSGESISDRIEIKKVLAKCEEQSIKGLVCVEPQRLSRGDLLDCGRLIDTLRYSNTMVVTPVMTYDLNNNMERRIFQDELLRGRDYLEYTKEILMRGKIASVNRGCYIQTYAPYGYDKIKIGRDYTLQPNEYADNVRLIFDMYVNGYTTVQIARHLEQLGIKSPLGHDNWHNATIDKMIKNQHYIGKIEYQRLKTVIVIEDGVKKAKRIRQQSGDYLCVEGKHPPIIDRYVFEKAQNIISQRPPVKKDLILRNVFAGILYCKKCGKIMTYKKNSETREYVNCKTAGCSKSVKYTLLVDTVIQALEQSELPNLIARYENGDGESTEVKKRMLKKLENELEDMKAQEEVQYELLETRQYTQDLFIKRNNALRDKMKKCEEQIHEVKISMPKAIPYKEKIATLEDAISSLKNPDIPLYKKNCLLKSIVKRIECYSAPKQKNGEFEFDLKIRLNL